MWEHLMRRKPPNPLSLIWILSSGFVSARNAVSLNMFAATPRFARGQSRISYEMLKSMRRVQVFAFQNNKHQNPKILKPKTQNPKLKPCV
jgi:hypothetical protein